MSIEKTITEKIGKWKGTMTFTNFLIDGAEADRLSEEMGQASYADPVDFDKKFNRLKEICQVRECAFLNQIVAVGREVFARLLISDTTYTGAINYGLLGTGSAAVTDGDTVLDTEVKRKGVATVSRSGTSVTLRFFYTKADTNGTYQEFGTMIDGTATVDTGQLFNRVLTGGWTKSAVEAMTVTAQFDLNPQ